MGRSVVLPRQRRLVPVREDIVEELIGVAKRSGLTLAELVEAILSHAAKVLRGRDDVVSVLADSVIYADVLRLGGAPVPVQGLTRLLDACSKDKSCLEGFAGEVSGLARLVALSARARGIDPLRGVLSVARIFIPSAALDIVENNGEYKIIVASPYLDGSSPLIKLIVDVLASIVEGFNGTIDDVRIDNGLIQVKFKIV